MLMAERRTDTFFKVFYDRMKEAQMEIKNTVSVNTTDTQHKTPDKDKDDKKKRKIWVTMYRMSAYTENICPCTTRQAQC
jgi:hypothetical protein